MGNTDECMSKSKFHQVVFRLVFVPQTNAVNRSFFLSPLVTRTSSESFLEVDP